MISDAASGTHDPISGALQRAGLTPAVRARLEHLLVGCGGFVRELLRYTRGASTTKADSDQRLSAADELVDTLVREELLRLIPGTSGYSEEGGSFGAEGGACRLHWLLDPVDGTRPALLGGAFAVSLGALLLEGDAPRAALGWVYVPTLGSLYHGRVTPDESGCWINDAPVRLETGPVDERGLTDRYLATESNWHALAPAPVPLKLSAAGSTAVNLTRLAQPGSDVAAVALTHYRPYDAAGALPVALGAGAAIYPLDRQCRPGPEALDPLQFLHAGTRVPAEEGPHVMVCSPGVAAALR